jgi:hypothetical protein
MGCAVASSGDIARIKGSCSLFSSCNLRRMYFCLSVSAVEFMRQFYHWACPLSGHKAVFTHAAMPLCLAYLTFCSPCLAVLFFRSFVFRQVPGVSDAVLGQIASLLRRTAHNWQILSIRFPNKPDTLPSRSPASCFHSYRRIAFHLPSCRTFH